MVVTVVMVVVVFVLVVFPSFFKQRSTMPLRLVRSTDRLTEINQ